MVKEVFVSYSRYWIESFRLNGPRVAALQGRVRAEGLEHLDAALERGHGAILGMPHLGNWDVGGAWLASRGYRAVAAVEALEPPELFGWFCRRREALGVRVVPAGAGAPAVLLEALGNNAVVGLVSDRDLSGRGVEVKLFGHQTTMPGGPALLSLRSGAPILPAAVYSPSLGCHRAVIRPPLQASSAASLAERARELTALLAKELESLIAAAPQQWHVLRPVWNAERAGKDRI